LDIIFFLSFQAEKKTNFNTTKAHKLNSLFNTYEGDTPSPLAYCVPPYFGLEYCVPPFLGLAYCVPFNNKKDHFWLFHLHEEDNKRVQRALVRSPEEEGKGPMEPIIENP